jgi:hypothetical protein
MGSVETDLGICTVKECQGPLCVSGRQVQCERCGQAQPDHPMTQKLREYDAAEQSAKAAQAAEAPAPPPAPAGTVATVSLYDSANAVPLAVTVKPPDTTLARAIRDEVAAALAGESEALAEEFRQSAPWQRLHNLRGVLRETRAEHDNVEAAIEGDAELVEAGICGGVPDEQAEARLARNRQRLGHLAERLRVAGGMAEQAEQAARDAWNALQEAARHRLTREADAALSLAGREAGEAVAGLLRPLLAAWCRRALVAGEGTMRYSELTRAMPPAGTGPAVPPPPEPLEPDHAAAADAARDGGRHRRRAAV